MGLVKRSNSKFWYVQFQINHVTIIRSTKTSDRRVAEQVASKIRADAHDHIVMGRKKPLTLKDALDQFVASKTGTPNHKSLVHHQKSISKIIKVSLSVKVITSALLEDYRRKRAQAGLSPQTIKHELNCLMGALKKARREGYDCSDVLAPIIKIPTGRLRFLSTEEEKRLLSELEPNRQTSGISSIQARCPDHRRFLQDNHDLIVILLDTGARYGEIANIGWNEINLIERTISLWRPKVQNESVIFMTDRVYEILQRRSRNAHNKFLFNNKAGQSRGYSSMSIRKAFGRAGLKDCTIHTLRHTHASRLIQNGLSVYEVRSVLGHSDIKTTMRYAHLEQTSVTQKARDVINMLTVNSTTGQINGDR